MSDPGRPKQVLDLCDEVLALTVEVREVFLREIDAGDAELGEAVRSLLQAVEDSGSFMTIEASPADGES